ncbi:MAG: aminotransferase class IV [Puniceicoccales bacterium]|jgi:branched-chain amino acid aminotransferase|nr:aminotransferase class IV [Puniceicoccales bacterium]
MQFGKPGSVGGKKTFSSAKISATFLPVKVYVNGALYDWEDAKISVGGEGFLRSIGVRDCFGCREGKFYRLDERLEYLRKLAGDLGMPFPWEVNDVKEALAVTYDMNGYGGKDAVLRVIFSAGTPVPKKKEEVPEKEKAPKEAPPAKEIAEGKPKEKAMEIAPSLIIFPHGVKVFEGKPLPATRLSTLSDLPTTGEMVALERNLLSFVGTVLARNRAREKGGEEGLLLDTKGAVTTCTGGEIFACRDGAILAPEMATSSPMQRAAIDVLSALAYSCNVQVLKIQDLTAAPECFLLTNLGEVRPITSIDENNVGDGSVGSTTKAIAESFGVEVLKVSKSAF